MIYLIGGMPRVGKSTLSKMLMERDGIPWMPLDTTREALNVAAPTLGVQEGEDWWPTHHEKFFPFFRALVKETYANEMSYAFEGDSFLPKHAAALAEEFGVKACFLGTSRLDAAILKEHRGTGYNWLDDFPEEKLAKLPEWIVSKSTEYKEECVKLGIPYFDVSGNQKETLEKAYAYLTNK